MAVSAIILTVIAEVLATWIITVFTHDPATFELAEIGFKIFAINFLFLKIYGAWLAVPIAEAVTLLVTVPFHKVYFIGRGEKNYLRG